MAYTPGNAPKRRKGMHVWRQNTRFDDDAIGATEADETPSNAQGSTSMNATATSKSSKNNRRKRKRGATAKTDVTTSSTKVLNGLIVAISTLESKSLDPEGSDADECNRYQNHKHLKELLQSMGATVSPQVHKRVHYLVATDVAVQNLTQRVRQALKRNVDIIDVDWVKECADKSTRVDASKHMCNEQARCLMEEKEKEKRVKEKVGAAEEDGIDNIPETGWSSPVQLDCCCVCHENGDDNCPWCSDCNLTLARKARGAK